MPYQQYNFKPQTFDAQKKRPDLRLLYISHSSYDKTWPSVLHSHPFTELFYVLNGTGTFQTETQTFCIAADDLILINPHVMHTEFSNGDAALEYVVLGFEGIAFETDGHAPITCLCKNVKTIRPACLFYTRSLIQELHDRKENYVEMSQNLLENLLYLIRREIRVTPEAVSVGKTSQECRMIEQYINAHYAETITLDTLSALTFHSKYYIAHAFTKYKGISPINYLITRRIEEAKSLLEHTDFPVAKIAQAVGIPSGNHALPRCLPQTVSFLDLVPEDRIGRKVDRKTAAVPPVNGRLLRFIRVVDDTVFAVFYISMHFDIVICGKPAVNFPLRRSRPQNRPVQQAAVCKAVRQATDIHTPALPERIHGKLYTFVDLA